MLPKLEASLRCASPCSEAAKGDRREVARERWVSLFSERDLLGHGIAFAIHVPVDGSSTAGSNGSWSTLPSLQRARPTCVTHEEASRPSTRFEQGPRGKTKWPRNGEKPITRPVKSSGHSTFSSSGRFSRWIGFSSSPPREHPPKPVAQDQDRAQIPPVAQARLELDTPAWALAV